MIKYTWAGIAAVVGVLLMVGIGGPAMSTAVAGEPVHAAGGTFTFYAMQTLDERDYSLDDGDGCQGEGGFSDIREGAAVKIRNGKGEIVASGAMGPGVYDSSDGCSFLISVDGVPRWQGQYTWELTSRGELPVDEKTAVTGMSFGTLGGN